METSPLEIYTFISQWITYVIVGTYPRIYPNNLPILSKYLKIIGEDLFLYIDIVYLDQIKEEVREC